MNLNVSHFLFLLVFFACGTIGCTQDKNLNLIQYQWLLGTWEMNSPRGSIFEGWKQVNDSLFQGKSYMLAGKDTIVMENMKLEQRGNTLIFTPFVMGQNSGQPVAFVSSNISNNELIFENPQHDFPQKISYRLINSDSLLAKISGSLYGTETVQDFPMKKISN